MHALAGQPAAISHKAPAARGPASAPGPKPSNNGGPGREPGPTTGPQAERLLRLPVSRTLSPAPTQSPTGRSSRPATLGGPGISMAHNAPVLNGTSFRRKP